MSTAEPSTGPLVSVVVPTHQRAHLLGRAVESVLRQTHERLELWIVDDGSTDGTEDLVRSWPDPRVRYLAQEQSGPSAARNRGAEAAAGRFLTFLDSDDEARPEWLARLVQASAATGAGLAFCGLEYRDRTGAVAAVRRPTDLGLGAGARGLFLSGTFLVERELFVEAGGYWPELPASENTELGFRLIDLCRRREVATASIDEPLVVSHRHGDPRRSLDSRALLDAAEKVLARHGERLGRAGSEAAFHAVAAVNARKCGELRRSFYHLGHAIRLRPWNGRNYLHLARTCWSLVRAADRRA